MKKVHPPTSAVLAFCFLLVFFFLKGFWFVTQPIRETVAKAPLVQQNVPVPATIPPAPTPNNLVITAPKPTFKYSATTFCDGDAGKDIHHEYDDDLDSFTVELPEGCWSGWIYIPKKWYQGGFTITHIGDRVGTWDAIWQSGSVATQPHVPDDHWTLASISEPVRMQGKGKVKFMPQILRAR